MKKNIEVWKPIEEFEGLYEVSNLGRVRSTDYLIEINGGYWHKKGKVLKQRLCNCREMTVCISCAQLGKKRKPYLVNRLVAKAFIPNPNNFPQAIHIDCNNLNNRADNLQWATHTECVNKELAQKRRSESLKNVKIGAELSNNFIANRPLGLKRSQEKRRRAIVQYDKDMNFIKEFDRSLDAQIELSLSGGVIQTAIRRNHKVKGFIFKYKEL